MKTVLITGCSSGFGLAIAKYFLDRDWKVVATMRKPQADILPPSPHLRIAPLDVTDADSIRQLVDSAGPIDVLVNNAGIGLLSVLEGTSMATIRDVFETNTFGTIAMTQAVLPQFRLRREGVVVNLTSSTTLKPLPMLSIYTASKAAITAFTESLALELEPFNVRLKLVIPGRAPETAFGKNARPRMEGGVTEPYAAYANAVFANMAAASPLVTHASDVAEAVWRAATDPSCPTRLPAGADAVALSGSD